MVELEATGGLIERCEDNACSASNMHVLPDWGALLAAGVRRGADEADATAVSAAAAIH
jgi:hypothetical protein